MGGGNALIENGTMAYQDIEMPTKLPGAADEAVLNCGEVLAESFGE